MQYIFTVAVNHKLNYIYLMHTTNTTEFIFGFIRFYVPCSSTLIMEEYKTLSCVHGYHEYQSLDGGSGGRTSVRRERPRNPTDLYAVVVKEDGITVGKSMR